MKPMVSNKQLMITLFLTAMLVGCSHSPTQPNYSLDSYTLTHSAIFTQKKLVNGLLDGSIDSSAKPTPALLNSYCDLIDRRIIFVLSKNRPQQCVNRLVNHQSRSCAMKFHICVRSCSLRSEDCNFCIENQDQCLEEKP